MPSKARGRPLTSLTGFIGRVEGLSLNQDEQLFFRGHSKQTYQIKPSVFRTKRRARLEDELFRELITTNPDEFYQDDTALERLARMQHHSCPTRLLDITTNPLVALYFSCKRSEECHGEVIAFKVKHETVKFFDSDTVSCLANLARMSYADKRAISGFDEQEFAKSVEAKRLVHFIRQEKPYFEPKIELTDLQRAVVVRPKLNNKRMLAQSGAFMIFGRSQDLEAHPVRGVKVEKISIDQDSKQKIAKSLDAIGINEGSLYLDIDSYARYLVASHGL